MNTILLSLFIDAIPMTSPFGYLIGLIVAFTVLAYLTYVLFKPEKF